MAGGQSGSGLLFTQNHKQENPMTERYRVYTKVLKYSIALTELSLGICASAAIGL